MTQTPEQKLRHRLYMREWSKQYQRQNPQRHYSWNKRWRKNNREKYLYQKARENARSEGKGFVPIAPNIWDCATDWHHLAPDFPYVISLPRKIHQARLGKSHFVFNAVIVCKLFDLNLGEKLDQEKPNEVIDWNLKF